MNIANKKPRQLNPQYDFTTEEVAAFIQKLFDAAVRKANHNIPKEAQVPNVNIEVQSTRLGKKIFPFIVILPMQVLDGYTGPNRINDNELTCFDQRSNDVLKINPVFWKVLESFAYTKEFREYVQTNEGRANLKFSQRDVENFVRTSKPKIQNLDGSGEHVLMLIDPVITFHTMLEPTDQNAPANFRIYIDRVEQIRDGNYRYFTSQNTKGSKKKKSKKSKGYYGAIMRYVNGQ